MNQVETDFKRAHAFFRKKWAERYPSTHLDEGLLWAGGCLYAALNSKRPLVIIGGPANARINYERAGQYVSAKRHFIFATNEAPGHGVRHAACYWDKYNLVGNWQFDANNLVLDPKVVELMFHNSVDEIFEWVKIGGETDGTFVSVAQSYGMFVLTFCRDRAKITRA